MPGGFLRTALSALGLFAFALAVGAGFVYVRLHYGSISLNIARPLIERAIMAELDGRSVTVEDVQFRLEANGGFVLDLRNVVVREVDGAQLAVAPLANVALSRTALARGRFAIRRLDLVSPRLQVFYDESGAVNLRFQPPPTGAGATGAMPVPAAGGSGAIEPQTAGTGGAAGAGSETRSIDLVRTLAEALGRARRREDSSAYLRFIGLKQAVVVVDNGHRKSVWNVSDAFVDLDHKSERSRVVGQATIASLTGPWTVGFTALEAERSEVLRLDLEVGDLNPRGLGRLLPSLAMLEGFDVPLRGRVGLVLPVAGGLERAEIAIDAGRGTTVSLDANQAPVVLEGAEIVALFDGAARRFDLSKARVRLAGNDVEFKGRAVAGAERADGGHAWAFEVSSVGGVLKGDGRGASKPVSVEQFDARGILTPMDARLVVENLVLRAGGGELTARGEVAGLGGQTRINGDGRIAPMPISALKALWPSMVAPGARAWFGDHVTKGQLSAAVVRVATSGGPSRSDPQGRPETRVSLAVEATGGEIVLAKGVPAIEVPRASLRIDGSALEITAADAGMTASEAKRLQFKGVRFTAVEAAAGEQPTAEIAFRVQGSLAAATDVSDRDGVQFLKSAGLSLPGLDGKVDGNVKLTLPLAEELQASEVRTEGKVRITDLRMKGAVAGADVNGGTIAIDLNDKAIDIKGDVLVRGVLTKVNWQYLTNQPPERQPPIRATLALDTADRAQLGLDVADIVQGETPVEIVVQRDGRGEWVPRIRVDLTKAELTIESIAFKKAAGRAATFQFDAVKGPGTGAAQRLELQNVRVVGDDIALEGWLALGPDNKLREMSFPQFSVNVVTRLDVQGKKRADNVWEIVAKGKAFDGRDLFRTLFSLGQISERTVVAKDKPGLDLVADIETVIGFADTSLKGVRIKAAKRADRLTELDVRGSFDNNQPFLANLVQTQQGRQLRAQSLDAGQVFRMVAFYPNAVGGEMKLEVNLDGKGANEKTGILWARDFAVLGDPVVSEVLQNAESAAPKAPANRRNVVRSRFDFDVMGIPFDVGSGQFVMNNAYIKGPLIGASWRGKVDFKSQLLQVGGTYVPAAGLNSALGSILGPLSGGAQGEGLFGITFAVQGPIAGPQVIVNPLSLVAPGIFREIFQMTPESFKVNPRIEGGTPGRAKADVPPAAARSSSTAAPGDAGKRQPPRAPAPRSPEAASGWSSEVVTTRPPPQ
jgi:hypothetical protein